MLVIGIVLLVVGAALILVPDLARLAPLGWLLAILGIALIVVALLDTSSACAAVLGMAAVPPGKRLAHASHGAGPTKADPVPNLPLRKSQPVIMAFLIGATPMIAAFVLQVLDEGGVAIPAWLRSTLAGIGALTTALAALWARGQVTPTAAPKLDDETLLVPMTASERTAHFELHLPATLPEGDG